MIRLTLLTVLALGLAGCGADGEPETPSRNATPTLTAASY